MEDDMEVSGEEEEEEIKVVKNYKRQVWGDGGVWQQYDSSTATVPQQSRSSTDCTTRQQF
jgi:hypothetical protein